MSPNKKRSSLTRYTLKHLAPFWKTVGLLMAVAVVDTLVPVINATVIQHMIDIVNVTAIADGLWHKLSYYILCFLLSDICLEVFWRAYSYFFECKALPRLRMNIVNDVFHRLLRKPYNFFQTNYSGQLANNVEKLSTNVPFIVTSVHSLLACLLTVLFSIVSLSYVHKGIAMLMLGWIIAFFILIWLGSKPVRRYAYDLSAKQARAHGKIVDAFQNILTIKLFGRTPYERRVVHKAVEEVSVAEKKVGWAHFVIFSLLGMLYLGVQAGSLFFLVYARERGEITSGHFAKVFYLNNAVGTLFWFQIRDMLLFSKMAGEGAQALQVLDRCPDKADHPKAQPLQVRQGAIHYDKIHFRYPDQEETIFQDLSLKIKAGESVGFVGYSGGGKSTLTVLLAGLYDLEQGRLMIDDQDIAYATTASLRQQIGLVPQNPILFHRSIEDNIRCAKPEATREEIIAAAEKAHAHAFITQLPQGYSTVVGEGGSSLSGGQRQRIAIARVILQNPSILLFDEATSALDSVTEQYIQASMEDMMRGKTTIVVAHRLSTLLKMDRIIVIDQGRIMKEGTHEALLAQKGLYYKLWHTQVNGFLGDGMD